MAQCNLSSSRSVILTTGFLFFITFSSFTAKSQQIFQQPNGVRYHLNGPSFSTEDLRRIDSYVTNGLPLFGKGFILHGSGNRPIIVKAEDPNKRSSNDPNHIELPKKRYYNELPAIIPEGYEGIASQTFQLGHPIPYFSSHSPFPQFQQQNQQYQQQHYQQQQYQQPQFQKQQPLQEAVQTNQPFFYNNDQYQYQQQQQQPQKQFQYQQTFNDQFRSGNFLANNAAESIRVENTLKNPVQVQQQQPTFHNFFQNPNQIQQIETREKFQANPYVQRNAEFEDSLPSELKNPFYRNQNLANILQKESLPAQGETVVDKWDTDKIRRGKIYDLLSGAGFI